MGKMLKNGELHSKSSDLNGQFVRADSGFRDWVSRDGSTDFPAEADRYHLYVSIACPWSHRTMIMRTLKGLEKVITVTTMDALLGEESWRLDQKSFDETAGVPRDTFLYEVYLRAAPRYSGTITVPLLWDKKTRRIVSNESADIMRMLNSAFDDFVTFPTDYYPGDLRPEIDRINAMVYDAISNGVYRAGFAASQDAYDESVNTLFEALDNLELLLSHRRYLAGNRITEADWRLFTTLVRFDPVYVTHFKTDRKRIADYPNLSAYLRELYQVPGISGTIDIPHIRRHYFLSHRHLNPSGIIPAGPEGNLDGPHGREFPPQAVIPSGR
ncbi:glutathione S-transferase family protein [Pelagibius sp. Alg239-R121]|uniref:glutathione S-transferase family protein n=1 Tax=Pelagibius sp. Alg239-R121 TaxID=2993448 RepID=UPI0024A6E4DB|nr:glutathione S-transferase family protein [Pelagibius sp. Alg239-R121]